MRSIRSRKAHHLSLIPFYVFCLGVAVHVSISRFNSPADAGASDGPDCEFICTKFAACLSERFPPEQVKMYSWTIAAGCRTGCAKQRKRLGACFTQGADCNTIQACIGSKL